MQRYAMNTAKIHASPFHNALLARLWEDEYHRLASNFETIDFQMEQVFFEADSPINCAYFIERGLVSVVSAMEDGRSTEVALVGNEGIIGTAIALGIDSVPCRYFAQVPGRALAIKANALKEEIRRCRRLERVLMGYIGTFLTQLMQVSACNRLHSVQQRCCRWLLMYLDRLYMKELPLTHDTLARLLGVRRASVTGALHPLQEAGIIDYHRGKVTAVDRERLEVHTCECYWTLNKYYARLLNIN